MTNRPFIVVSGLPASGKTTMATALASALDLSLLDKDEILEALFESFAEIDVATRQKLSRASDVVLARIAASSAGAVIVSFWRHDEVGGSFGTPTEWVRTLSQNLVEVRCQCPAALAEQRFKSRRRHAGHNDAVRLPGLSNQFYRLARAGPLGLGPVVSVRTDSDYEIAVVAQIVRGHLANR